MRSAKKNLDYATRLRYATRMAYLHLVKRGGWAAHARHYKLCARLDQVEAIERMRAGQAGFTLLEMLVVMILLGILMPTLGQFFTGFARSQARAAASIRRLEELQQNSANATAAAGALRHCAYNDDCTASMVLQCFNIERGEGNRGRHSEGNDFGSTILLCSEETPCLFENGSWYISGERGSRCHATKKTLCNMGVIVK